MTSSKALTTRVCCMLHRINTLQHAKSCAVHSQGDALSHQSRRGELHGGPSPLRQIASYRDFAFGAVQQHDCIHQRRDVDASRIIKAVGALSRCQQQLLLPRGAEGSPPAVTARFHTVAFVALRLAQMSSR